MPRAARAFLESVCPDMATLGHIRTDTRYSPSPLLVRVVMNTPLCTTPCFELRDRIVAGEISAVEVIESSLESIGRTVDYNAFREVFGESALTLAKTIDMNPNKKSLPLCGVPIAIKDVIATRQGRTSCGSRMLAEYRSPFDATAVERLLRAGAIPIGKTNMDEFAMGSSSETCAFGAVKNPWDPTRVPGGSSGGSAVAVADGSVPVSLGTDTGGSIRQPAAFCGVSGLRPTYGRVSRYGLVSYASSLDQIGTFARSAKDCALLLQVIGGHDVRDSTSVDIPTPRFFDDLNQNVKGVRVGIPREYFSGEGIQSEVREAIASAITVLKGLGVETVDIELPHTELAVAVYYIIAPAEASSNLARYDGIRYGFRADGCDSLQELYSQSRSHGFGWEVKRRILIGTYVLSSGYYDAYYLRAQKVRALIKGDFERAFDGQCDAILCPTAPSTAFEIGSKVDDPIAMYLGDIYTIPANLAGLPGISVPCGHDTAGLPVGLQLIGKPWGEQEILNIASAYQEATDWHARTPVERRN